MSARPPSSRRSPLRFPPRTDPRRPASGHSDATIKAATLSSDANVGSFIVYVDDYLDDTPVPLVTFTTSSDASKANNDTRMIQQLDNNKITLSARAGDPATPLDESSYKDVMAERNARLVWDSATQTLYYKQDRGPRPTIISLR